MQLRPLATARKTTTLAKHQATFPLVLLLREMQTAEVFLKIRTVLYALVTAMSLPSDTTAAGGTPCTLHGHTALPDCESMAVLTPVPMTRATTLCCRCSDNLTPLPCESREPNGNAERSGIFARVSVTDRCPLADGYRPTKRRDSCVP